MRHRSFILTAALIFILSENCLGAEAALDKAWSYYLKGDYEKAVSVCRVISKSELLGEEGRYILGLSFLQLNRPQEARKNFEFLLENYPDTKNRENFMLGLADSYYTENSFDKAAQAYIGLLKAVPGANYAPAVYLRLGECQRKQGLWQKSESSFYKILQDYPLSLESSTAKDYLSQKQEFFSVQAGAFSRYDNAANLCEVLKNKGYDAYAEKVYEDDKLFYRVRVGKFDTEEKARLEAEKLEKDGFNARVCD